jgi:hypothetical protein
LTALVDYRLLSPFSELYTSPSSILRNLVVVFSSLRKLLSNKMLAVQSLLLMAAALSASVFAAPSGADMPKLEARYNGYDCSGTRFTQAQADNGFGAAIQALRDGTVYYNGASKRLHDITIRTWFTNIPFSLQGSYPGVFRNGGNPPEVDPSPCRGKELLEFPILTSNIDYTGGPPGPHRVVVAMHGGGSTAYDQCFLMTHQGASGNLFVKCQPY